MSSSIPTVAEKRFSESERQFFYNMGAAATFACEKSTCTVRDYIYIYICIGEANARFFFLISWDWKNPQTMLNI